MAIMDDSPHGRCATCGMGKMEIDGRRQCPNCIASSEPKTGQTIIVTEPQGEKGNVKIQRVSADVPSPAMLAPAVDAKCVQPSQQPGLIQVGVPVELFPELVVFARKLKLPKNWAEAEKIRAITEFQVQLNKKLGELTR